MDSLWPETLRHLSEGNFTALQDHLGGPEGFHRHIVEWHSNGSFEQNDELLAEALSCACMLGRTETAGYLLDAGVDPYAGMRTGLSGPHYAVSSGRSDVVELLLKRGIALEVRNSYGGTLLGQALWSATFETKPEHLLIVEKLLDAGSVVEPWMLDWWNEQLISSDELKERIALLLSNADRIQ